MLHPSSTQRTLWTREEEEEERCLPAHGPPTLVAPSRHVQGLNSSAASGFTSQAGKQKPEPTQQSGRGRSELPEAWDRLTPEAVESQGGWQNPAIGGEAGRGVARGLLWLGCPVSLLHWLAGSHSLSEPGTDTVDPD